MDDRGARGQARRARERIALASAFAGAAVRYWLMVFPSVCRELRDLRRQAGEIPDPVLRGLALDSLAKRGNIEGAAAFAAFAPGERRGAVVRGMVFFQAAYNYLDLLAEQPHVDAIHNGHRLHEALLVALDPGALHIDYYEHCPWREDGGYLAGMIDACRGALQTLPSYGAVAGAAERATTRIAAFQSMHLSHNQGDHLELERWGREQTPVGTELEWWETAASGGSSLGVFALIALAGEPVVGASEVDAVERAYFPWIGALHSLLDNLVDRSEDALTGQRSLVGYYASSQDAALHMQRLALRSSAAARALGGARRYTLVLAAMASYYLSMPEASEAEVLPVSRAIKGALGGGVAPALVIFRVRRLLDRSGRRGPARIDKSLSVAWRSGWGRVV